jgi:hypothetical protein
MALSVTFIKGINAQIPESFEGFMNGIRSNEVTGAVVYQRTDVRFPLEPGLKMEEGDLVRTGSDGYAELVLQPGNLLRVGSDSECQIISVPHDKMRIKLNRGAVIIEILAREGSSSFFYTPDQANELIRVITPNAEVFITRPGIFRINASDRQTELVAQDGEALINGRRVKEKRRGVVANGSVTIDKIATQNEDRLDIWARERAQKLVQANKSLKRDSFWAQKAKEGKEVSVEFPDEEEPTNPRGRVISAKPGAVNYVEDGVEFTDAPDKWQALTEKSELKTGDTLRTKPSSFVELVLFPDMHLRLDGSSEILLKQLSNDAISLKLLRGSAILDVARFDRKQAPPEITLGGASSSAVIDQEGNYRIDVKPNSEEITIRQGRVIFNGGTVSSCRTITGGSVADCDKKRYDNFDFWSQHRGEGAMFNGRATLAVAIQMAGVRTFRFKKTGFWYQQPGQTSYTFVPFSSLFLKSPYGGNYSTVLSSRPTINEYFIGDRPITRRPRPQLGQPQPVPW